MGITDILGSEAASNIVISVIALIVGVVLKLKAVRKYELDRCILAIQSAVQEVYEGWVKSLKQGAADGKLTDNEKQEARDRAYELAKQILMQEGIDLAKYYGPRIAKAIIEATVKNSKTTGIASKAKASGIGVMPLSCLLAVMLCGSGCIFSESPEAVANAMQARNAALTSYARNTGKIIDAVIGNYVDAEKARAGLLRDHDIAKLAAMQNVSTADAIATMKGIQERYEANVSKINAAADGIRQAVTKAQTDLAIVLKLQDVIDRYHGTTAGKDALQGVIDQILGLLANSLKGE